MTRSIKWLVVAAGAATVAVSSMVAPDVALAQRRVARRAPRPVVHVAARPYPVYYRPYFSYGGYAGWYSGWYNWYGGPPYFYGQYYPYPYGGYYYRDHISEARLQVQPKHAEVFIDGYFVGTVDDFDGWSQRLRVEPGEHELEIFLEGYRSFRENVLFRPGSTVKIERALQPLAAGEQPDARPTPAQTPAARQPVPARRGQAEPAPRRPAPAPAPPREGEAQDYGAISIRVQPPDAEVIVNGERWESPEAGDFTLQLSAGTHRVEVRKPGFRTYSADILVRRGETTSLNVSLSRQ